MKKQVKDEIKWKRIKGMKRKSTKQMKFQKAKCKLSIERFWFHESYIFRHILFDMYENGIHGVKTIFFRFFFF